MEIGAKMSPNCLLEASLGLRGDLWRPCGSPGVSRGLKPSFVIALFGTILELIFGSFRDFEVFVSCFFGIMVFDHFGDPIYMVLKLIFDIFCDVFYIFLYAGVAT